MVEVYKVFAASLTKQKYRSHSEKNRTERNPGHTGRLKEWDITKDNNCFDKKNDRHPNNLFPILLQIPVNAQLDQILHADVDQDQGPGNMILRVISLPIRPYSFGNKVKKEHVYEQEDVIADPMLAVDVDVVSGEIPDLDHCKCRHYIRHKSSR